MTAHGRTFDGLRFDGDWPFGQRISPSSGPNSGALPRAPCKREPCTVILDMDVASKETSTGPEDKTLEMMTADELAAAGITPVHKLKVLNLSSVGYLPSDKPEGYVITDRRQGGTHLFVKH